MLLAEIAAFNSRTEKLQFLFCFVLFRGSIKLLFSSAKEFFKMPVPVGANMGGPSTVDKCNFALEICYPCVAQARVYGLLMDSQQ